ncbi:uncharacterized protein FIBRA_07720 [Fibroporia radiculosa]|uniref:F-box domain-containing protein n=1 Tax=Fibroporia radiculosa TaxID=599839 RepID=J4I178_9APHY|nr:uncharacterized protein FIBRA_07720 [Fibroporia radiculosa]CCM05497.1 predicted protein [Fibroporia radiculosa]
MNVALACSPQDAYSAADREEGGDVATVHGAEWNVRSSCWDTSIAERTVSQLCDICPVVSSRLPTELWELIIDFIAEDGLDDMGRLGQVCRGWHARCRFRSHEILSMRCTEKKEVYRLIRTLGEHPERSRVVKTVLFEFAPQSIGLLGSFAVRTMQTLPRVKFLRLSHCKWESGRLHAQVFLHLTLTFGSVTKLELFNVTFPSAVVFGRLVRALPRLSTLECQIVRFQKGCHVVDAVRVPGSLRLDAASLNGSDDVFDFLVSIGAQVGHLSCYGHDLAKLPDLLAVSAESLLSLDVRLLRRATSIDLTPAVNLRILSLAGHLKNIAKEACVLSGASLPKLVEVTIESRPNLWATLVSVQDTLNGIDNDSFARMDRILSGRQFPALFKVTLLLRCEIHYAGAVSIISEGSWCTLLSSKLPALHASGRLLITVNETEDGKTPAEPLTLQEAIDSICTFVAICVYNDSVDDKEIGVLFGGVTGEDTSEESFLHNDLYGYQIGGNWRGISMLLKRPKKKTTGANKQKSVPAPVRAPSSDKEDDESDPEKKWR